MLGWPGDTDPAIAQTTTAQQFQYASCAKLVNYPDPPSPDQSRLVPEIAEAMPTVSPDGLTYTFQVRNDYAFSPPASGVVTAESMKWTLERVANPNMPTPGYQFLTNVVGADAYHNGQAPEITGISAQGDTLTINLIERQGDFLTFLAMPFFCALPTTVPPTTQVPPIPSAGPTTSRRWSTIA